MSVAVRNSARWTLSPPHTVPTPILTVSTGTTDDRTTLDHAAGRVYKVCEEPALSELAWQQRIAAQAGWRGEFVVLPRQQTPEHLLQPGNAAQHVIASSERIRAELGYREAVGPDEACAAPSRGKRTTLPRTSIRLNSITRPRTPLSSGAPESTPSGIKRQIFPARHAACAPQFVCAMRCWLIHAAPPPQAQPIMGAEPISQICSVHKPIYPTWNDLLMATISFAGEDAVRS